MCIYRTAVTAVLCHKVKYLSAINQSGRFSSTEWKVEATEDEEIGVAKMQN